MRKATLLGALVAANFVTSSMGTPITGEGGKFSVSNIAPVVFTAFAGLFYLARHRQRVDTRLLWFMLVFNVLCSASFVIFLVRFGWQPNFLVLFFQDLQIIFCALLWWYEEQSPEQFRSAVRFGLIGLFPVAMIYGWVDLRAEAPWFAFGMDDKSQGAVLFCCAAYIAVRFLGSKRDRLFGVLFYLLSFLTVSRLPVFFFPALMIALMQRSRYALILTLMGVASGAYAVSVAGDFISRTFTIYQRLSSIDVIAGADSTTVHLLLLKAAMQMKFSDLVTFIFGIGPGNFSKALTSFSVHVEDIEALDPNLVAFAREGRAPLHSMALQFLLDYNLVLFLGFVYFVIWATRFLLRRRNFADVAFFWGLLSSSTFYSLHNKPYFFLFATTVAIFIRRQMRVEERLRGAVEAPAQFGVGTAPLAGT